MRIRRAQSRLCHGDTPFLSDSHGVYCLIVQWALQQMATVRCGARQPLFSTRLENKRNTTRKSGRAVGIRLAGVNRISL